MDLMICFVMGMEYGITAETKFIYSNTLSTNFPMKGHFSKTSIYPPILTKAQSSSPLPLQKTPKPSLSHEHHTDSLHSSARTR